jgi:hypothetical protein
MWNVSSWTTRGQVVCACRLCNAFKFTWAGTDRCASTDRQSGSKPAVLLERLAFLLGLSMNCWSGSHRQRPLRLFRDALRETNLRLRIRMVRRSLCVYGVADERDDADLKLSRNGLKSFATIHDSRRPILSRQPLPPRSSLNSSARRTTRRRLASCAFMASRTVGRCNFS